MGIYQPIRPNFVVYHLAQLHALACSPPPAPPVRQASADHQRPPPPALCVYPSPAVTGVEAVGRGRLLAAGAGGHRELLLRRRRRGGAAAVNAGARRGAAMEVDAGWRRRVGGPRIFLPDGCRWRAGEPPERRSGAPPPLSITMHLFRELARTTAVFPDQRDSTVRCKREVLIPY